MYKYVIIFFSIFTLGQIANADVSTADIKFTQTTVNFGTIFMEDGKVTAKFSFTNNGQSDFIIKNVEAACGCTVPRSTKDTFAPGEKGYIIAEFDPKGITGDVKKWVYVSGNFNNAVRIELKIRAFIKSTAQARTEGYYRGEYGYLLVNKTHFDWGNITKNATFTDSITLTNDGYGDIQIKEIENLPDFMTTENLPLTIPKGKSHTIHFDINTEKLDTVGPFSGAIKLITTDKFFPRKEMFFTANFIQDFSRLTKRDLKNAPKLTLSTNRVDMGIMKSGEIKRKSVQFTNSGKSNLIIKRIDKDCSCTILKPSKNVLAPGESMSVSVSFDALFKEGLKTKIVRIYTNDPINPILTFQVKANIK